MNAASLATLSQRRRREVATLFSGLATERTIVNFVRVMHHSHEADPLGASDGPSRFSSTSATTRPPPFRVLYAATDLATAVHETLIRDRFDLDPSRALWPADYGDRIVANISTTLGVSVRLLDLTDGNAVRHGVPSDVTRHSHHAAGQHFATFVHDTMPWVDGLLYRSRFTDRNSIAIFDRSLGCLVARHVTPLTRDLLATSLRPWNVTIA